MPRSALDNEEARRAQTEALRGAGLGALKYGAAFAFLGGLGYAMSPIYRGLTIQFKVYIQMSGMILGGMIEADSNMRRYEQRVRVQRMIARDRAMWKDLVDDDDLPQAEAPASKK
ncbi:putative imidazoleglycerol-phosphate dehydratase [Rosellinia necatrix]|uniref:Putative imidazoleglycerol-phosphate dehydratase n=1 Tax=Rosellinia necatrix TaxID=77044 RepID=A0A1S8AA57_ROSNE|nr:putative imidazoleglycerol-phosphate dehydratase [Rosellinia necatrix]